MSGPNLSLQSLLNSLSSWLGRPGNAPLPGGRSVTMSVDNTTEPAQILSPRVLVVVFDPIWDRSSGRRLLQIPETARWSATTRIADCRATMAFVN